MVHEPLRLPRPGARLDRRKGLGARLHALQPGPGKLYPPEVIPPAPDPLVAPAAAARVRAGGGDDVDRPPFELAQAFPQALAVSVRSRREQLLLRFLHALVIRQHLRRIGPIRTAALETGEKRGFRLLRTDAKVGARLRAEAVRVLRRAIGSDIRGIRLVEDRASRKR